MLDMKADRVHAPDTHYNVLVRTVRNDVTQQEEVRMSLISRPELHANMGHYQPAIDQTIDSIRMNPSQRKLQENVGLERFGPILTPSEINPDSRLGPNFKKAVEHPHSPALSTSGETGPAVTLNADTSTDGSTGGGIRPTPTNPAAPSGARR
jgi:hypothetical protein